MLLAFFTQRYFGESESRHVNRVKVLKCLTGRTEVNWPCWQQRHRYRHYQQWRCWQ